MEQEVYVDLYFLINACMDLLSILLTATLTHRATGRLRSVLGACFGGAYAVLSLFFLPAGIVGMLLDVLSALLICVIAFYRRKTPFLRIVKILAVFLLVSVLLGGIMTVLYSLLNRLSLPLDSLEKDTLSVWIFSLLAAVAGFATAKGGRFLGMSAKTKTVTLELSLFGSSKTLTALVDSGNLLCDPVTGKSVIVVRREALRPMLPRTLSAALTGNAEDWLTAAREVRGLRLIPAQSVSDSTLLPALAPERLTVTTEKETYDADYLIAIADLGESAQGFDAVISLH
ncbi:MAG: sigma-E processing peptidase SpoIIGA [Clostridia bacterium]|nr:sigma-E processing peptidase SpoIIGA [Clostridia bacterium]